MDDFKEQLAQLKKILPPKNFLKQPETAKETLRILESHYNISTEDFIDKKSNYYEVSQLDREFWLDAYMTCTSFKESSK